MIGRDILFLNNIINCMEGDINKEGDTFSPVVKQNVKFLQHGISDSAWMSDLKTKLELGGTDKIVAKMVLWVDPATGLFLNTGSKKPLGIPEGVPISIYKAEKTIIKTEYHPSAPVDESAKQAIEKTIEYWNKNLSDVHE